MAGKTKKAQLEDKKRDTSKSRQTRNKSPVRKSKREHTSASPDKKSPSRRSPAKKSPARKSPARTKSPGRPKSPARVTKSVEKSLTTDKLKAQPPRKTKLFDTDSESDTQEPVQEVKEKPKAAVRGRTRRTDVVDLEPPIKHEDKSKYLSNSAASNMFGLTKRQTRFSQTQDVERVVHLKHFDASTAKLGEFSDEDEISDLKKSENLEITAEKYPAEFGGSIGALFFTIALPLTLIGTFIVCNENSCSFTRLPNLKKFTNVWTYLDLTSILGYTAYTVITALLFATPFGGKKVASLISKHEKWTYTINGLFSLLMTVVILISLEARSVPVTKFIVDHIFHLGIASTLIGMVISIYAYIASFYAPITALNIHAIGKGRIYAFFMGREVNPRFLNVLDLKMFSLKHCLITTILLDAVYFYKSLDLPTIKTVTGQGAAASTLEVFDWKLLNLHPTLILLVVLHLIYLFDALIHEAVWLSSFEIQYEGYGYMSGVGYMVYPFLMLSGTKYISDYNVNFATWKLCVLVAVFLLGYVFFRGANNQKDAFRKNPYNPALSHLETIPTMQGKKLLVSGFWGIVRHPNYLGDILMMSSFAAFIWCVPPVIILYSSILLLIHRAHRDNARCKQKYGAAWERYCQRVKNVLIPKVY